MSQQTTLSPKANRNYIIGFVIFIALFIISFYIAMNHIEKKQAEDDKNTAALPSIVKKIISIPPAYKLREVEATNMPVTFKKYLYLNHHSTPTATNESLGYSFHTDMNEELNTMQNLLASDIDGLVLDDSHSEIVGYYENDDIISIVSNAVSGEDNKKKENKASKGAYKLCRVLTYVSVPDGTVLQRDSIWGGDPPRRIKRTQSTAMGDFPDDSEVIRMIKSRIKE